MLDILYIFYFTESVSSNLIDFNTEIPQPSDSTSSNTPLHGGAPTSFFSSDSSSQQHPITGYLFRIFLDYWTYLNVYEQLLLLVFENDFMHEIVVLGVIQVACLNLAQNMSMATL